MRKYFFSSATLFFLALPFIQSKAQQKPRDTAVMNMVSRHQILLTNYALFKDHKDAMQGASAFLINYRHKIFAVTAKHVLGSAMGIEPEIKIQEFNRYLISWKMFPRVPLNANSDTVIIGPMKLKYDNPDKDILLLEVANDKFDIFPLIPDFNFPKKKDKLFIIGCPYSEEKCKQNIYEVFYDSYDMETSTLKFKIRSGIDLSGFSGAPIIDSNGNVVSIVTSGWDEGKTHFIGGTFIREIQNVK